MRKITSRIEDRVRHSRYHVFFIVQFLAQLVDFHARHLVVENNRPFVYFISILIHQVLAL